MWILDLIAKYGNIDVYVRACNNNNNSFQVLLGKIGIEIIKKGNLRMWRTIIINNIIIISILWAASLVTYLVRDIKCYIFSGFSFDFF